MCGGIAVGRIYADRLARSQCEGCDHPGHRLALYEKARSTRYGDRADRQPRGLPHPGIGDTPEIDIHFHEEGWDRVPAAASASARSPRSALAASVGNAVFNATGWRPHDLPVRPDRLSEGMRK